jgi:hypothetical protein
MSAQLARLFAAGLGPLPVPEPAAGTGPEAVARHGRRLLAELGVGDPGAAGLAPRLAATLPDAGRLAGGIELLLGALARRDPERARTAGRALTGLGPGLTPLGDDLLAGATVTAAVLGPHAGLEASAGRALRDGLLDAAREGRTTAFSAELLELAARGWALPPLAALLDPSASEACVGERLAALLTVGASSGSGAAAGVAAACFALPGERGKTLAQSRHLPDDEAAEAL